MKKATLLLVIISLMALPAITWAMPIAPEEIVLGAKIALPWDTPLVNDQGYVTGEVLPAGARVAIVEILAAGQRLSVLYGSTLENRGYIERISLLVAPSEIQQTQDGTILPLDMTMMFSAGVPLVDRIGKPVGGSIQIGTQFEVMEEMYGGKAYKILYGESFEHAGYVTAQGLAALQGRGTYMPAVIMPGAPENAQGVLTKPKFQTFSFGQGNNTQQP